MTDEEKLFHQTASERKRIARGDFNKVRQGGRTVRFPSDSLTERERKAMNGEVKRYDMARPVEWKNFKRWPADLQKTYILGLEERFGVRVPHISIMLGVSDATVYALTKKLGIKHPPTAPTVDTKAWSDFINGGQEHAEPEAPTVTAEPPVVKEESPSVKVESVTGYPNDLLHLLDLLTALKGSGAKLTIEVTL